MSASYTTLYSDYHLISLPGYRGSGAEHWQTRWEGLFPSVERVEGINWSQPDARTWATRLLETAERAPRPAVVVAHSFGCLATVAAARLQDGLIRGALLVAPAAPERFGLETALPFSPLPFPATVVASSDDPWLGVAEARRWSGRWGADLIEAGALGHINAASGLGEWPLGQSLLHALLRRVDEEPRFVRRGAKAAVTEAAFMV